MPKSHTPDSTTTSRRSLFAAAAPAAALALASASAAATAPEAPPTFYSTLNPEQKAAFDKLHAIVKAQANGTWVEPPDPDADLITLCNRYVAFAREFCNVGQHTHEMLCSDPEWIRCHEITCAMVPALHAMEAEITDAYPQTVRGVLAKAEAARHQLAADADRDDHAMDPDNALAWSLIEDVLDVIGSAAA